jgi:hypothetical protein
MKTTLKIILFILLMSCEENKAESSVADSKEIVGNVNSDTLKYTDQLLDSTLLCGDYSYMHGYFAVPYNGCIYQPNSINKIGNVQIYLIPKRKINENNIENEENLLNTLSIDELKNNYNIYVFSIDKKFLIHDETREVIYYAKSPYKQVVYNYSNGWKQIKILNIENGNDSIYTNYKSELLSSHLINENVDLDGGYKVNALVTTIENEDTIRLNFYFTFHKSNAMLSIGTNEYLEAYCEGNYKRSMDGDLILLEYVGEGLCPTGGEGDFVIKYEDNKFLIRSKRFLGNEWQVLMKN